MEIFLKRLYESLQGTLTLKPKLIAAMIPYFSSYIPPLTLKPKYIGKNDMAIRKGKDTEKL